MKEEEQAQGDEHQPADDLDHPVVIPEPAKRTHRLGERDSREQKGQAEDIARKVTGVKEVKNDIAMKR